MDIKERCQSCGMPLGEGFYGTNADGSPNHDYCKYCYKDGKFTDPGQTLEGMINRSVNFAMKEDNTNPEEARRLAEEVLPKLKRWQNRD